MKLKIKEKDIQKAVIQYLQLLENQGKLYFIRAGSGLIKTERGNWFRTGKTGCPDIICLYKKKFIGLEIKTESGKQSIDQVRTEKSIKGLGGDYYIIRGLEDIIKIIH